MTYSRYMRWLHSNDPQAYGDKLRATDNAGEILMATTNWVNESLMHPRKDKIAQFARGDVLLRIGSNDYSAQVVVGTEADGRMKLYDIIALTPTLIKEKETATAVAANPSPGADRNTVAISNESISNDGTDVKEQFSIRDTGLDRHTVAADLRAILNRGGDVSELRRYVEQMDRGTDNAYQNGRLAEQNTRNAYQTTSEAEQILHAARDQGVSVDEYLRQNWEQYEYDGELNEAARQALDLERRGSSARAQKNTARSGVQYSFSPRMTDADIQAVQNIGVSASISFPLQT